MTHSHKKAHSHHEAHVHCHPDLLEFNRVFLIAIIANGLFVVAQIIVSSLAHSTSLLADAVHNLGDVLSLILAWIANGLLRRTPTEHTTYGMKKTSILAALANGILLVFSCGIIVTESIYKLFAPTEVQTYWVMGIAGMGIVINGVTAMLFVKGRDDLNIQGAFLHLLYDALISVGVLLAAAALYWTHWLWLDPLVGLVIAFLILKGTWSLFSDSFRLIIDGVPRTISWTEVRTALESYAGVSSVHDLHIWALSTKENALSVHLGMPVTPLTDEARQQLVLMLKEKYNIHHATIQVEQDSSFCKDACIPY